MSLLPGMVERTIPGKLRPTSSEILGSAGRVATRNTNPGFLDYSRDSAMRCEEFSPRIPSMHAHIFSSTSLLAFHSATLRTLVTPLKRGNGREIMSCSGL
jgi:hypothetical protein